MSPLAFITALLLLLFGSISSTNAVAAAIQPVALGNGSSLPSASDFPIQALPITTDLSVDTVSTGLNALQARQDSDNATLTEYALIGVCYSYLGRLLTDDHGEGWNKTKELWPCQVFCQKDNPTSGYGCIGPNYTTMAQVDPSLIYKDDDGLRWTPGYCNCDYEIAVVMMDIIAEGLGKITEVMCAMFLSIFRSITEVGSVFAPGGEIYDAMTLLITGAKTAHNNALGSHDYFDNWVLKECGMSGFGLDFVSMFLLMLAGSDQLGSSKGCSRKNPLACITPKAHPDPPKDIPRPAPKDPWGTHTPPTNDIPRYCSVPRAGRLLEPRAKCKAVPNIAKEGYTYRDLGGVGFYQPGTFSIKCPSKKDKNKLDDVAVLHCDTQSNTLTVAWAYLDKGDSLKKLKLRDMMVGIWKDKGGGGIETLNTVVRDTVVEKGWVGRGLGDTGTRGKVQDLMGVADWQEYTMHVGATGKEKEAFDMVMRQTSQGVSVFRMLEEYAAGLGRQVVQIDVKKGGGSDDMHFTIGPGATP